MRPRQHLILGAAATLIALSTPTAASAVASAEPADGAVTGTTTRDGGPATPTPAPLDAAMLAGASVVTVVGGGLVMVVTVRRRHHHAPPASPRVTYRPRPLQRWDPQT